MELLDITTIYDWVFRLEYGINHTGNTNFGIRMKSEFNNTELKNYSKNLNFQGIYFNCKYFTKANNLFFQCYLFLIYLAHLHLSYWLLLLISFFCSCCVKALLYLLQMERIESLHTLNHCHNFLSYNQAGLADNNLAVYTNYTAIKKQAL